MGRMHIQAVGIAVGNGPLDASAPRSFPRQLRCLSGRGVSQVEQGADIQAEGVAQRVHGLRCGHGR